MFRSIKQSVKDLCLGAETGVVRLAFDEILKRKSASRIALIDHSRVHEAICLRLQAELGTVLSFSNEFETEMYVRRFEADFAKRCDRRFAVGTHSGTSALQLALVALNIGVGDEVITVPNTYIATALAISNTGAKPVFVDMDDATFNIDPRKIESAITSRTKAIIPVHLYGQMAKMSEITKIASARGLKVIEDACQAFGAEFDGHKAGSQGDVGCFSFSTPKNLSGFGNGGIIVSDDKTLIEKIRLLRNPEANHPGLKLSRRTPCYLDAIQVAFIRAKLPQAHTWTERRRAYATHYRSALKGLDLCLPEEAEGARHSYYRYAVRTKRRAQLKSWLQKHGIRTATPYSPCLHLTLTYSELGYTEGSFPRSEGAERDTILLPISPFLTEEEIEKISQAILGFFSA